MSILNGIKNFFSSGPGITKEDIIKIRKADWEDLAIWWDTLNSYGWPKELLPEEPKQEKYSGTSRRSLLMQAIEYKTGMKWILRILNMKKGTTEEAFEDFWNGSFNGDQEALERWHKTIVYPDDRK